MTYFLPILTGHAWRRAAALTFSAIVLTILVGCTGDERPTGPVRIPVAYVHIAPLDEALLIGAARTLQATPISANGTVLEDRPVTWESDNGTVATVNADGMLTALAEGTVGIVASSEGKTSRIDVRVIAPNPVPVITAITPSIIPVGSSGPVTVTVSGIGFTDATRIRLDDIEQATLYVDANTLRLTLSTATMANPVTLVVTAATPAPGGGVSNALPLSIDQAPIPTVPVAHVTVQSPSGLAWTWRNHGVPLRAVAADQWGNELADRHASWSVANPTIASTATLTHRDANAYGAAVGETDVEAVVEGVRATRTVRVHETPGFDIVYEAGAGDERHLMLWDLSTGNGPRRLYTSVAAFSPSPSPDGQQIAFAGVEKGEGPAGNVDLFIVMRDGRVRRVAPSDAFDADPAWSPDGTRLAFTSSRWSGSLDVFVVDLASTVVTRLTDASPVVAPPGSGVAARAPAWSPDGTQLAYSVQTATGSQLWAMSVTGANKRRLTNSSDADDYEPVWSPDGTVIAFAREFRQPKRSMVMTVRPDGSNATNIGGRMVNVAATPSYSPDGQWLTTSQARGNDAGAVYAFSIIADAGPRIVLPLAIGGGRHARWVRRP